MTGAYGKTISIGDLSDRTQVSVRALRYYEQHGLLPAVRSGSGHRRFHPDATETVRRIRLFLDAGLPLAVVAQIMPCFTGRGEQLEPCVVQHLREHTDRLQERLNTLVQQHDATEILHQMVAT